MKSVLLYIGLCCCLIACTNDNINTTMESDFYGDWVLISSETGRLIDYDFDGNTAMSIIDDFNCFTIELKLNPDNTFNEVIIDRSIVNGLVECSTSENIGKWKYLRDSNQIEFDYTDINGDIINTVNSLFSISKNDELKFSREFNDNEGTFKVNLQFSFINN